MNKILGLFLIGLILNGCSQTNLSQPTTNLVTAPKITPTPVITKAIDWLKIDRAYTNIVINNFPSKYPEAMKNMVNLATKGMNVSQSQALRILYFPSAIHEEGVIQEIQNQLEDDFAHYEWGFITPDQQAITQRNNSPNDEDVIKNYRLLIITKPNVKAETYIYTFKNGYTLPIQILPIAKWTDSQLSVV